MKNKKIIAEIEKLKETIAWLGSHDRNDVEYFMIDSTNANLYNLNIYYCAVRYFYNGEVKVAELSCNSPCFVVTAKNNNKTIIAMDTRLSKYYQIDKATAAVTEIPKPKLVDDKERKSKVDILEERIEYLSKELHNLSNISAKTTRAVENQEELLEIIKKRIESVDDVVEFANLYGADNLHIWLDEYRDMLVVSYLYDNRKHQVDFDFYWERFPVCVQNGDIAILECNGRYFQLDKAMETIVMIPKPAFITEKKSKTKNGKKDNKKTGA